MNIMHNKTKKIIMQLRHATHGERRNSEVCKYQLISQPELDKFQTLYCSKCLKWCPLDCTQQCGRLCHSATDRQRRRSLSLKPVKASSATRQCALGAHRRR